MALLIFAGLASLIPETLWFRREGADISQLNEEASRVGGSAAIPEGGVDFRARTITLFVEFNRPDAGDEDFARLARMPAFKHLFTLSVSGSGITDQTFELLENHQGFPLVDGYPMVAAIDANGTKITDRALKSIATSFPRVSSLGLRGTSITDKGLDELIKRSASLRLSSIDLTDTSVTADGVRRLREAFARNHLYIQSSFKSVPSGP